MFRKQMIVTFTLLMIVSMILSACQTAAATPAVNLENLPTLRINLGTWPDTIDPQKASFVNEIAHLKMIYEGLTRLNEKLETVPGAAEKWEYNKDATQLTFTLRKGLKYSDGSPLNAKRYEYSILRNINPATAGEYATITDEIMGAPEWRGADVTKVSADDLKKLQDAVGVKALDGSGKACTGYDQADCLTLQLSFSKPAPYFHTVMSLWVTYPAKEELITKGGENWWGTAENQIGNGPMAFEALEANTRALFKPNTNYWRGVAKVKVEYRYVNDSAVAFQAYKNNEFDIIGLAAEDLATATSDATLSKEIMKYPGSCTYNLSYHNLKEPFNDLAVREAFSYAFDREGWVKDVLKGLGAPTQTWIPQGFPGYDSKATVFPYDPAKAKSTLEAAGYKIDGGILTKDGKQIPITLTFSDTPRNRTRNEWIAGKWKQDLGLDVQLNPVESTTYTALTKDVNTAPQTFILGWCADYPDPQNWLSVYWRSDTTFASRIGFKDEAFDKLTNQADVELDAAKRMQIYQQAQEELYKAAPGTFLWNNVNVYLVKPTVKGIATTPQDSDWAGSNDVLSITIEGAK